jgi:hypothetical protein
MNNERKQDEITEKQPYTRPELVTHGKVENLTTQPPPNGTSQPIDV